MVLRKQSMSISSRLVKPEVLRPLVKILGEDTRALRAKVTALRNTAAKGLKNYGAVLQQVYSYSTILQSHCIFALY